MIGTSVMYLLCLLVGWIVSGSWWCVGLGVVAWLCSEVLRLLRRPLNRLIAATFALLLITLSVYGFSSGRAELVYEAPAVSYHFALGFLLWAAVISRAEGVCYRKVGGWLFYISLVGALALYWSALHATIFRYQPWAVRSLAAVPLIYFILSEYTRRSRGGTVLVFTCIGGLALGLLSLPARMASVQLSSWLSEPVEYDYDLLDGEGELAATASDQAAEDGAIDLPRQANISVDESVRFYLDVSSIEDFLALTRRPLYLRTSTVSIFESDERILPIDRQRWILDGDDGTYDTVVTLSSHRPENELEYSIVLPAERVDSLPLVNGTDRVRASEVYHHSDGRYQLSTDSEEWLRYSAIGPRRLRGNNAVASVHQQPDAAYVELPDTDLQRRIRALAPSEGSPAERVERVREIIHSRCEYSLNYRNPKNLTPVENLLFAERKGHCELFATATVMLLRSAGVPARVAYGYTGGAANRKAQAIAFRTSDIHAWAEVLGADGQWQVFDTTPATRGAERLSQVDQHQQIDWRMAAYDPELGYLPESGEDGAGFFLLQDYRFLLSVVAGLLVTVVVGVWLGRLRKRRRGQGLLYGLADGCIATGVPRRPAFVEAILSLGEQQGCARPVGATLREYTEELLSQGIGIDTVRTATDYYYQTVYEGQAPDLALEKRWLQEIRAYQKSLH